MIGLPWLLRMLPKFGGLVYAVFLGCVSNYLYDQLLKPLQSPPVDSGILEEVRPVAGVLAPPQQPQQPQQPEPPPPPTPPGEDWPPRGPVSLPGGTSAEVYVPTCSISDRQVKFCVVVFSDVYSWSFGEAEKVELNKKPLDDLEFQSRLQSPRLKEIMAGASELIAVGTASCEGSKYLEEGRAFDRGWKLKEMIERLSSSRDFDRSLPSPHVLPLGYWQQQDGDQSNLCKGGSSDSEETWYQRRVILMAVRTAGLPLEEANLQSCIQQSLKSDPRLTKLDQLLKHYSLYGRFVLDKKPTGGDTP